MNEPNYGWKPLGTIICRNKGCKGMLLSHPYYYQLKCSDCGKYYMEMCKYVEAPAPKENYSGNRLIETKYAKTKPRVNPRNLYKGCEDMIILKTKRDNDKDWKKPIREKVLYCVYDENKDFLGYRED